MTPEPLNKEQHLTYAVMMELNFEIYDQNYDMGTHITYHETEKHIIPMIHTIKPLWVVIMEKLRTQKTFTFIVDEQ